MVENEFNIILQEFEEEDQYIQSLGKELEQLVDTHRAVRDYGSNPTAIAIMQTTGLLSSTALDKVGLESFTFDDPKGDQSQMALESLGEKIKDVAARWSAKILHMVVSTGAKAFAHIEKLWEHLKQKLTNVTESVKAHPYKTAIAVLASIAAVTAIILYCKSDLPGANTTVEAFNKFNEKLRSMISKIHSPFGRVTANVNNTLHRTGSYDGYHPDLTKLQLTYNPLVPPDNAVELSQWTPAQATSFKTTLDKTLSSLKAAWKSFGETMVSAVKSPIKTIDTAINNNAHKYATGRAQNFGKKIWAIHSNKTTAGVFSHVKEEYDWSYDRWFNVRRNNILTSIRTVYFMLCYVVGVGLGFLLKRKFSQENKKTIKRAS